MIRDEERILLSIALAIVSIKRGRGRGARKTESAIDSMRDVVGSRSSRLLRAFNSLMDVLNGVDTHKAALTSLTEECMAAEVSDLEPMCNKVQTEISSAFSRNVGSSLFEVVTSGGGDCEAKKKKKRALRVQTVVVYIFQNAFRVNKGGGVEGDILTMLTPLIEAVFNGLKAASGQFPTTASAARTSHPEQLLYAVCDAFLAAFCHLPPNRTSGGVGRSSGISGDSVGHSPSLQQAETLLLHKFVEIHDSLDDHSLQLAIVTMANSIDSARAQRAIPKTK